MKREDAQMARVTLEQDIFMLEDEYLHAPQGKPPESHNLLLLVGVDAGVVFLDDRMGALVEDPDDGTWQLTSFDDAQYGAAELSNVFEQLRVQVEHASLEQLERYYQYRDEYIDIPAVPPRKRR